MSEDSPEVLLQQASQDVQTQSDLSLGGQLAAARQQKNWTVQYVAEQLKLSPKQITSLEKNEFNALPQLVIVRGFVRAYAKLLRLEGDVLVGLLPVGPAPVQLETSLRPQLSTPFVESRNSINGQADTNRRYVIGVVLVLLLAAVFVFFQRSEFGQGLWSSWTKSDAKTTEAGDNMGANLPTLQVENTDSSVVAPDALAKPPMPPSESPSVATHEVASLTVASPSAAVAANSVDPIVTEAKPSAPSALASPVLDQPALTSSAGNPSKDEFVLKFKHDSWVYVKTQAGQVLTSHLAKAGTQESFPMKQTLYVKIGNVAGVEAFKRGENFALVAEHGSNVANLVVK